MNLRLRAKFSLFFIALILTLVVFLSGAVLIQVNRSSMEVRDAHQSAVRSIVFNQIESHGIKLTTTLADALVNHVYLYDMDSIRDLAQSGRRQHGVSYLYVHDMMGRIIHDGTLTIEAHATRLDDIHMAKLSPDRAVETWITGNTEPGALTGGKAMAENGPPVFHVSAPIVIGNDVIGGVRMGFSFDAFAGEIADAQAELSNISDSGVNELLVTLAGVTVLLVAIGLGLADQLARWLTRPIEIIAAASRRIGRGEYGVETGIERTDEIGDLASNIEQMARSLEASEASLMAQHKEIQKRQMELMHLRKLESLGGLTAGIAHNLNNFMQPIGLLSEVLMQKFPPGSREQEMAKRIIESNRRASELLRNLMTYARQDVAAKNPESIATVVDDTLEIVAPTLPSTVVLNRDIEPETGTVLIDKGQIQTVVMNLVSNALDSLEGKPGEISVSLSRQERDGSLPADRPAVACISVADTGSGMDDETLDKMFDPFFTTKETGKGTGLGLSTAFGIVNDHGGAFSCESRPGKGTRIEFVLPLVAADR
ncbi:MAG: ATP-binding protein [Rhodospirillales bacterium]